jgi:hypothetical protein
MMTWVFDIIFEVVAIYRRYWLKIKISIYRRLGEKIGRKARLYGKIDGVNPHVVTIGDYSVFGGGSGFLAHYPVHGPQPASILRRNPQEVSRTTQLP